MMPLPDLLSLTVAILTIFVAGGVVFYVIVREPKRFLRVERVAYCYPLGMTALALVFFPASYFGMRLNPIVVICGVLICAGAVRLWRRVAFKEFWLKPGDGGTARKRLSEFEWFLILIIVACLGARAIACFITPMCDWDSLNNWGIRSKLLYWGTVRSYDNYFRGAEFRYLNQSYPLLWPFMYAWVCTVLGRWDDIRMFAINPLNLIIFCVLLFCTIRKFAPRNVALAVTAVMASLPASMHYTECGQADIPLMLISGASLFCLVAWMQTGHRDSLLLAAVLMAGALFTKTEGQVVFGAHLCTAAASVFVAARSHDRMRRLGQLVLYFIIPILLLAPWLLYRATLPWESLQVGGHVLGTGVRWDQIPTFLAAVTANAFHFYNQYNLPKWNVLWPMLLLFFFLSKSSRQFPWILLIGTFLVHAAGIAFVELISQEHLTLQAMEAGYERYTLIMLPPLWLVLGKCVSEWWSIWQTPPSPAPTAAQPRQTA